MGLIFYYGPDKSKVDSVSSYSKDRNIKQLTPLNRNFLQSLGYKVINNNNDFEHIKRNKQYRL